MALYQKVRHETKSLHEHEGAWDEFLNVIVAEWNILANLGTAAGEALASDDTFPHAREKQSVQKLALSE